MSFLSLFHREMQSSLPKLMLMSALGGLSTAAILAAINAGMQSQSSLWAAVLFLVSLLLFIKAQYYVTITTTAEIESIIHKIRVRLMDHIRRSELLALEDLGRARIVAAIGSDTAVLTQASNLLAFTMQGAVLILFIAIYVAFLSLAAITITAVVVTIAAVIFHIRNRRLAEEKQKAAEWERRLFDRLTDFLDGFKEVRLNGSRSDDLFNDAFSVSRTAANIKIHSQAETFKLIIGSQLSMYVLLGAVVFVAPQLSNSLGGASLTKTTTALMFVVGACFGLVQLIPILATANAAADRIDRLEAALRGMAGPIKSSEVKAPRRFEKIELQNIVFHYVDKFSDTSFQIGPIDFTLHRGDLVFITGGNGSGKSTFLRILAGLYPPDSGEITLDGMRVNNDTRDTYRALMSGIFFDYHLFQRLYGIPEAEAREVDRLLAKFRLQDRTTFSGGEFSTLDISTGQRRRLALLVAMLEKRPILLLDEWTSEQDPEFRHKFYDEFVPDLMRAGTTLVAITHDERYLDELRLPAHRIRMDEGRIAEQQ
jgi:putative ATP-binding cassette transporter